MLELPVDRWCHCLRWCLVAALRHSQDMLEHGTAVVVDMLVSMVAEPPQNAFSGVCAGEIHQELTRRNTVLMYACARQGSEDIVLGYIV